MNMNHQIRHRISRIAPVMGMAAGALLLIAAATGDQALMREKLTQSQLVLEGITLKDFGKIEEGAKGLQSLSMIDEWLSFERKDDNYRRHSQNFREIVDGLEEAARQKNIMGATLRYSQMTFSCVQCHEHLREGN